MTNTKLMVAFSIPKMLVFLEILLNVIYVDFVRQHTDEIAIL